MKSTTRSLFISTGDSDLSKRHTAYFHQPGWRFSVRVSLRARSLHTEANIRRLWIPDDHCHSQAGVCDDRGSSALTIACFAYPKDEFRDKPQFSAAAFFVAGVQSCAV